MIITIIHGLAAKPEYPVLKCGCTRALGREIQLAYWADLMGYKPVPDYDGARPYAPWEKMILPIRGAVRWIAKEGFEIGLNPDDDPRHWVKKKLHDWLISKTDSLSLRMYHSLLPDLDRYFNHGFRDSVKSRLVQKLPCDVLIAHSMGSIIAADLLADGIYSVPRLITIGSPLGIGFVQEQLGLNTYARREMLRRKVGQWININDPLDIVALDSDLSDEFTGVKDLKVWNEQVDVNGHRHHHSLYGYLRSKVLQEQL